MLTPTKKYLVHLKLRHLPKRKRYLSREEILRIPASQGFLINENEWLPLCVAFKREPNYYELVRDKNNEIIGVRYIGPDDPSGKSSERQ